MKSDTPAWTDPAMQVIRDHDPDLYRQMTGDDWDVYVVTTFNEPSILPGPDGWILRMGLSQAFGLTDTRGHNPTWLNRPDIEGKARDMGVPVQDFLADVLVHEYTHHREDQTLGKTTEASAFSASSRFARKLGPRDLPILRLSQATGKE